MKCIRSLLAVPSANPAQFAPLEKDEGSVANQTDKDKLKPKPLKLRELDFAIDVPNDCKSSSLEFVRLGVLLHASIAFSLCFCGAH